MFVACKANLFNSATDTSELIRYLSKKFGTLLSSSCMILLISVTSIAGHSSGLSLDRCVTKNIETYDFFYLCVSTLVVIPTLSDCRSV